MTPRETYLEAITEAATPIEIVGHLYRYTLEQVQQSRRHLSDGAIIERSSCICRAIEGLGQLLLALDHENGGDLTVRLEELYHYIRRRLTEGNAEQRDDALAEAEKLLTILQEGWDGIRADTLSQEQYTPTPAALLEEPMEGHHRSWVL
jgi:flagellar protein FliS